MKKTDLLDLISYSDKKKNLLILLQEGPKTLHEIKTRLEVTSIGILPQIIDLENGNLVQKMGRKYMLTELGEVIALYFTLLIKTLRVIEDNEKFWTTHDLKAIPPHLLKRINELGECKVVERSLEDWFEEPRAFMENLAKSKWIVGIASVYHPGYPPFFLKLAENGVEVSLILTKRVFNKVKNENQEQLSKYLSLKNAKMFTSNEDIRIALATTDCFFSMFLFFKDGSYDPKRDFISFEPSAMKWGKELYEYYLKEAEPITKL